jgi:mono/diheme cytochrome c family protein
MPRFGSLLLSAAVLAAAAGCDDMASQPKDKTWRAAQPVRNGEPWPPTPPEGMVVRSAEPAPPPLSQALIERGRQRFDIYCSPCHGKTGQGNGMIVQRGFPHPPDYHQQRLYDVPTQHFYDVISNGYGIMYSFAARVAPPDRWAIAAYIRALQLARNGRPEHVPPDHKGELQ